MLIVSHDRYFINKIADRILLLTNNGVKEYLGNYDYYLERTTAEKSGAVPTENKKDKKEKTQNDYFLQKQKQSEERKRQTKLKKAEAEIERLDEEIAKTQELLSSEEVAADYEKLMELSKLLEDLQNSRRSSTKSGKNSKVWQNDRLTVGRSDKFPLLKVKNCCIITA